MKKRILAALLALCMGCSLLAACTQEGADDQSGQPAARQFNAPDDEYKLYYEIFVGSFYDSDGDGMGDLQGVIQKLDYLNDGDLASTDSLHVGGIWLMPVCPSPTYHKYDSTDFYGIDPDYGTLDDFDQLARECNARGIDLIIDFTVNHTASAHPWFLSACKSIDVEPCGGETCTCEELCREHNPYCDWYNFTQEYKGGYHAVPGADGWYYEGQFNNGMPDLNLDSPTLREEIAKIAKHWLSYGIKGFRLDTVINYYTGNTTANAEFLSWFYEELKADKPDVYLVAEAWTYSVQVLEYAQLSGIPSYFNFALGTSNGAVISSLNKLNGEGLSKMITDWDAQLRAANPGAIDAPFLSNHDNARSASNLTGKVERVRQAAAVYLWLPGNPFIYYGEEIMMKGGSENDPNKRAPITWSLTDKTGECDPPEGTTKVREVEQGVAEALADECSLLRHYIELVAIRNTYPALARGALSYVESGSKTLCCYETAYEGVTLRVLHNVGDEAVTTDIPEGMGLLEAVDNTMGVPTVGEDGSLLMPPHSSAIIG